MGDRNPKNKDKQKKIHDKQKADENQAKVLQMQRSQARHAGQTGGSADPNKDSGNGPHKKAS